MENTSHTLARRVADFIKDHPPFSLMDKVTNLAIAQHVDIQYYRKNSIIFEQDEALSDFIYMVHDGSVDLYRKDANGQILVDVCDEGDLFGVRPLIAEQPYTLTATAREDTLLYAIPSKVILDLFDNNPVVASFFASNFAAGVRNNLNKGKKGVIFQNAQKFVVTDFKLVEIQSVDTSRTPITCTALTPVETAASIMSAEQVGYILVLNKDNYPVGIVTDIDLRQKIATGQSATTEPVSVIMSQPVITIHPQATVAELQILMIKNKIHHLCVTEDGSPDSPVIGVISEHDLLVIQANNPAVLIRDIQRAKTGEELGQLRAKVERLLKKYLNQEVSIKYMCNIVTEINDVLIQRAVDLAQASLHNEGIEDPFVDFAWMALGSQGRGEQLLRTDQDSALVYADVPDYRKEEVRSYFLSLAKKTTGLLREAGFAYCPGGMMASNPNWCKSLSAWKDQFSAWINHPGPREILNVNIFFDFRPIQGDRRLATELSDHIFETMKGQTIFLSMLAKHAIENPPPLSFFRNFILEKNGENKNEFNIKQRAMMPIVDAARILILNENIPRINNTIRRLERMAVIKPNDADLFLSAAESYAILMRFRTTQGLANGNTGRYFDIKNLTKMERLVLRNCFKPISDLLDYLKLHFKVNLLL